MVGRKSKSIANETMRFGFVRRQQGPHQPLDEALEKFALSSKKESPFERSPSLIPSDESSGGNGSESEILCHAEATTMDMVTIIDELDDAQMLVNKKKSWGPALEMPRAGAGASVSLQMDSGKEPVWMRRYRSVKASPTKKADSHPFDEHTDAERSDKKANVVCKTSVSRKDGAVGFAEGEPMVSSNTKAKPKELRKLKTDDSKANSKRKNKDKSTVEKVAASSSSKAAVTKAVKAAEAPGIASKTSTRKSNKKRSSKRSQRDDKISSLPPGTMEIFEEDASIEDDDDLYSLERDIFSFESPSIYSDEEDESSDDDESEELSFPKTSTKLHASCAGDPHAGCSVEDDGKDDIMGCKTATFHSVFEDMRFVAGLLVKDLLCVPETRPARPATTKLGAGN